MNEPSEAGALPPPLPPGETGARAARANRAPDARRCPTCAAPLRWDPEAGALLCAHCGGTVAVEREAGAPRERLLSAAGGAARGLGLALRVLQCRTCGARVALEQAETARTCDFCGSGAVLAVEESRNALRPESVVPLDVGLDTARGAFRRWVRGLWLRPSALRRAELTEAVGLYVPFWTFDVEARSSWEAEAGHHVWVPMTRMVPVNGRMVPQTTMVRQTRWERASGRRSDRYDDLLRCASRGLSPELVAELGPFDLRALVAYRPEYLAGWRAEEYQLDLADAWTRTHEEVRTMQVERCSADVPGDEQRGLRVETELSEPRWKLVLLPVWSLRYRHAGRDWAVLVHGQSGRVAGKAPLSWAKVALAVLGALLALALVVAALALSS